MNGFLAGTNIWLVWSGTLLLFFMAADGSRLLGRWRRRLNAQEEGQIGPTLGGLIGLLGLLIAFTFGMASARFDTRRHLQVDMANALGTAYLRVDLLPESMRGEARDLLRACVDQQLAVIAPGGMADALSASQRLHQKLWALAVRAARESPNVITGLFVQAVNQVIDTHGLRVTLGWNNPLPSSILAMLYFVCFLVLSVMGFENGISGGGRPVAAMVMVIALSSVVLLILDLDRAQEGLLRNSQQAMIELRDSIAKSPPTAQ